MTRFAGKCRTGKEIASVTTFLRNDKKRVIRRLLLSLRSIAMTRFVGKCLFAIKRFVDDFCEAKITFPYETSFCKFFCIFLSVYFVHIGFLNRVFYEIV